MEVPRDQLIPILTLKSRVIFKLFNGRHEGSGLKQLTHGRKSYAIAEVLSTSKMSMELLDEDTIKNGGFPSKDAFKVYWNMCGYREYDPIYVIKFNLVRLTSLGKWYLRYNGERIPFIKDTSSNDDINVKRLGKWKRSAEYKETGGYNE